MTTCFNDYGRVKLFGYKHSPQSKIYEGRFELVDRGDQLEIWALGVMQEHQRKGYATQMLMEFLSQFPINKPLFLYVYKSNEIAIRLYEKVGFTIVGDYGNIAYTMQYNAERRQIK